MLKVLKFCEFGYFTVWQTVGEDGSYGGRCYKIGERPNSVHQLNGLTIRMILQLGARFMKWEVQYGGA